MKKIILLFVGLLPMGCIQLHYNIAPEFHSEGAVNIDGRIDADDPRVTVTVDDVTVDWKELKELIEKKMANLPTETKQKTGLASAQAVPSGAVTLPTADAAVMGRPAKTDPFGSGRSLPPPRKRRAAGRAPRRQRVSGAAGADGGFRESDVVHRAHR